MISENAQQVLSYVKSGLRILQLKSYVQLDIRGDHGIWGLSRSGDEELSLTCRDPDTLREIIAEVRDQGHTVQEVGEPSDTVLISPTIG